MELVNMNTAVSRLTVITCLGPRLMLFFKAVALFYVIFPTEESSIPYAIFKCAPILCLIGFVLLYGLCNPQKRLYSRLILFGLIFSLLGDVCLVFPDSFQMGVGFFAIAHLFYIGAFGRKPVVISLFALIQLALTPWYLFVLTRWERDVRHLCLFYGFILSVMIWRAVAVLKISNYTIPWTSISRACGAALFGLSDSLLCFRIFSDVNIHLLKLVLPTYYMAQMFISVSVVDRKLAYLKADSGSRSSEK